MSTQCPHLKGPITSGSDKGWYYCANENRFSSIPPIPPTSQGCWKPGLYPEIVEKCLTGKCPYPTEGQYKPVIVPKNIGKIGKGGKMKKYLLSAILFLSFAGGVYAETVTRYYMIGGANFQPSLEQYDFTISNGCALSTNTSGITYWFAPINLPDSIVVIELMARVIDNDASSGEIEIWLRRDNNTQPVSLFESMAVVTSSGSGGWQELIDSTIDYPIIDNANYKYFITLVLQSGSATHILLCTRIKYETTTSATGKEESKTVIPQKIDMLQNHPNPSSGVTNIAYQLPKKSKVSLKVYDSSGRIVRTLVDSEQDAGHYTSTWYGKDNSIQAVPNGNYFYRLNIDGKAVTKKAIVLR